MALSRNVRIEPCPMCHRLAEVTTVSKVKVFGCSCVGNRTWLVPTQRELEQFAKFLNLIVDPATIDHDPGDEDRG